MKLYLPLCQCPATGLLHFYLGNPDKEDSPEEYQCPATGLLYFYARERIRKAVRDEECQCPSTGLSHFYQRRYDPELFP